MAKLAIINASPRAPRSNSKKYADAFKQFYQGDVYDYTIVSKKQDDFLEQLKDTSELLFVFPLYVDSLPVILVEFLKVLANVKLAHRPKVHVLINCGFIEPEQNLVAIDMMKLFAEQAGYSFGSVLCIGGGEAIMETPFAFLAKRKIKKLAYSINQNKKAFYKVTMPMPKKLYIKASTSYWIKYGQQHNLTQADLQKMEIEVD